MKERDWKDGEYNNTWTSKLLYAYADPLLDIADEGRLESEDAVYVPKENLIRRAVTRLEDLYGKCRYKAQGGGCSRFELTMRKTPAVIVTAVVHTRIRGSSRGNEIG